MICLGLGHKIILVSPYALAYNMIKHKTYDLKMRVEEKDVLPITAAFSQAPVTLML
jgi:hypothetical protein